MTAPVESNIFDPRGLADIKRLSKTNDPQALKAAARQFEAMFLQMVLKSMRDATPKDGIMDSDQTRMYEQLLDQQLSQSMATKGGTGLAAMIEKQLSRPAVTDPEQATGPFFLNPPPKAVPLRQDGAAPALPSAAPSAFAPMPVDAAIAGELPAGAQEFLARVWPHAKTVSAETGIPAQFLVAHAALETGWGKSEPRHADGRSSYNLFGIKAGKTWGGQTVDALTTEYVDGAPQRQTQRFRAYNSYSEAFRDYGNLLASNPRYSRVLGASDGSTFARGLQQAGYATDPQYAAKLERIISGPTLRFRLTG
ncbi:MAG TPA: flagellar assembly peptidoglycan hydrolase FlgJ [Rhodocyclaceae bacterium]|nr:flagellar assembly peptidoglycan hydrolase FlgJ [Rhodocyclaceae bacterium]